MRTTLDLDETLLRRARELAAAEGRTLTAVIESALAAALAPRPRNIEPFRLVLETERGEYIGGVDLADRDAVYEAMESRR